jgi:hypothetical protein
LQLDWSAPGASAVITDMTLNNALGGRAPLGFTNSFSSQSINGSWLNSKLFAGKYLVKFAATVIYPGNLVRSYSYNLSQTISLNQVTPPSGISFPDVKTKMVSINYAGSHKTTKVAAVTSQRLDSIKWLAGFGITAGSGADAKSNQTTFRPQDTVNRGAMAQFLQKLAGFGDAAIADRYKNASNKFSDIVQFKKSNPARYYAILWLADSGITSGCNANGTKFCPSNLVNRGAMAQFMQKFAGISDSTAKTSKFSDVSAKATTIKYDGSNAPISVTALASARIGAINWLASSGITSGSGSSSGKITFKPQDPVTRGAMAQFMHKLAYQLGSTTVKPQ